MDSASFLISDKHLDLNLVCLKGLCERIFTGDYSPFRSLPARGRDASGVETPTKPPIRGGEDKGCRVSSPETTIYIFQKQRPHRVFLVQYFSKPRHVLRDMKDTYPRPSVCGRLEPQIILVLHESHRTLHAKPSPVAETPLFCPSTSPDPSKAHGSGAAR